MRLMEAAGLPRQDGDAAEAVALGGVGDLPVARESQRAAAAVVAVVAAGAADQAGRAALVAQAGLEGAAEHDWEEDTDRWEVAVAGTEELERDDPELEVGSQAQRSEGIRDVLGVIQRDRTVLWTDQKAAAVLAAKGLVHVAAPGAG